MSKFSIEKEQEIIKLYLNNNNTVEIAKKYNTFNTSIRRVLLRNNITIRTNSEIRSYLDSEKFNIKNLSREEYYYLGLLITDGSITKNRLSLGLKEEDEYMLKSFASFLGKRVSVNKYLHKVYKTFQYQVKIRNKTLVDNLNKLAVFKNKTKNLKLHIELNFDILRGIIDGDGSITELNKSSYIHIHSISDEFLIQIQDFLLQYKIKSFIKKEKNCKKLSIYKNKDVYFLYEKMYYSTDLFLIRKKNKFGPLLKKFKS